MKVLIGAYACEPGAGSEPGAGWAWARAAALDHDVWVLTRKNNAPAIEQALAKEPQLRLHPVYIDLPAWARFWKKGGRGVHLYYLLWQALAWRVARRLHRDVRFDVSTPSPRLYRGQGEASRPRARLQGRMECELL